MESPYSGNLANWSSQVWATSRVGVYPTLRAIGFLPQMGSLRIRPDVAAVFQILDLQPSCTNCCWHLVPTICHAPAASVDLALPRLHVPLSMQTSVGPLFNGGGNLR